MAYTAVYSGSDIGAMTIDFLGASLYAIIGLAAVVGLVALMRWYRGKKIA